MTSDTGCGRRDLLATTRSRSALGRRFHILPPSAEVLLSRLKRRGADDRESLSRRLIQADTELQQAATYDYVVVNDDLDEAVAAVETIIDSEGRRTPRRADLTETIDTLRAALAIKASELES